MEYRRGWRWSLDGRGCAEGGTVVEEKVTIKRERGGVREQEGGEGWAVIV